MKHFLYAALALLLNAGSAWSAFDLALDVKLDPATRQFSARAELQPRERQFRFWLHESLRVTSASAAGQTLKVDAAGSDGPFRQWRVNLAQAGQALVINYQGQLPALEKERDHRSVLGGMPPMAAPEGSFLSSGSAWYPRPAALFSYQLKLSLPGTQRGLVAGKLISETLPGKDSDSYQASFEFAQPADGIDLMAGPWIVREKRVDRKNHAPLVLRTYFPADLDALPGMAQGYLDDSATYIARYSEQIGTYPYSEFSIVASPLPTGFGMPTLTYLGADVLRLPFIRKTSLGHEILHNWWGNGVYVDYQRGNWSEGLTTFMADYAYKEEESAAAASEVRLAWLRDAAVFAGEKPGALRDFRSRANAAGATVGYGKAAMVFVMLRDRIGQAKFDQGIRNFWIAQRFRIASWDDLQTAFEKAAGEKLGEFFTPWLEQQALPGIAIQHAEAVTIGKQYQLDMAFSKSDAPLPLRLPVEISGAGQQQIRWIDLAARQKSATLKLDFQPQSLRLDPDLRVWRRLDASQLPPILRQWIAAKSPQLINVAATPEAIVAVNQLSGRFFETQPQTISPAELTKVRSSKQATLLAGTHSEVDKALSSAGLPARPATLAGQGSAQVWTIVSKDYQLAVISGKDANAINALQRGLPHYGGQSWLIFDQGRATQKGVWPTSVSSIPVALTLSSKDKH
jgi:hypothetical protein